MTNKQGLACVPIIPMSRTLKQFPRSIRTESSRYSEMARADYADNRAYDDYRRGYQMAGEQVFPQSSRFPRES